MRLCFFCRKKRSVLIFLTIFVIEMNIYDLIIFIPVLIGFVFGLFKGFVREVVSFFSIVLAFVLAEMFNDSLIPYIQLVLDASKRTVTIIAYVLIFVGTIVSMMSLAKLIDKLLLNLHLSWLNSLLGALFGALKFAIIISIAMNVFDTLDTKFKFVNQQTKNESIAYYPTLRLSPTLWEFGKTQYYLYKQKHFFDEERE